MFDFPYSDSGKGPDAERQEKPHAHHILEGEGGKLYVCDLGSDRVWVIEREGEVGLKVVGWLQCPGGAGPRHAVLGPDGEWLLCGFIGSRLGRDSLLSQPRGPAQAEAGS